MSWKATGRFLRHLKQSRGVDKKPPPKIKRWNIRKGDTVQILAGRDKGKHGKVILIDRVFSRVYVQGMNTHMVYVDAGSDFKGKMQREAPLHYSNVALVDPEDNLPCRIKYMYTEDGEKVRVSNRSGKIIPWPINTKDLSRIANPDGPMDTKGDASSRVTFIPSLLTFEEEMAQKFAHLMLTNTTPPDTHPATNNTTPTVS